MSSPAFKFDLKFSFLLSPPSSRGRPAAAWRPAQKLLHGAEFPRPEPGAATSGEPGRGGGGGGQRWPDGGAAASLAGPAAGGPLVSRRRLLDGTQRLSRHAALRSHRVELSQPRPEVWTHPAQRRRTDQVADGRTEIKERSKWRKTRGWHPVCVWYLFILICATSEWKETDGSNFTGSDRKMRNWLKRSVLIQSAALNVCRTTEVCVSVHECVCVCVWEKKSIPLVVSVSLSLSVQVFFNIQMMKTDMVAQL